VTMPILDTERMHLILLTRDELEAYLSGGKQPPSRADAISREILTETLRRAIGMKLEKLARAPSEDHPWISYWLMRLKTDGYGIGMLGFKGIPDREGQVEIGYGIDPSYQNQGLTTEAAVALIAWAFRDPRCRRIIAPDTRKDNPASNRVLQKVGMRIYQETDQALSWCLDHPGGSSGT
jgi:ribosomal-protein-alanine N-acetyltransferase